MDTWRWRETFSCLTDAPLRLAVIDVGQFTSACYKLQPGDDVYIRGPHGAPVIPKEDANIIALQVAPAWQPSTKSRATWLTRKPCTNLRRRTKRRAPLLPDECREIAEVHIATMTEAQGLVAEF